ncbi:uncharacterized protein LOC135128873 [Zophobas morio]|uniref:uncharacterized protein LOC135128873 n=1 Tax=Zophobas morio TaxID=2755281 RepID=UPI003082F467
MEDIIENSFGVNLILMRILNLYPPENPTLLYKLKAYCVFFVLLPPVPILGALYFLFEENLTTEELNENAFAVAQLGCQVTKFLPFVVNGTRIKNCILYFKSSEFKISVDKQQKIIDDCCWICRRNSTVFLVSITGGVIFFALKPLFSDKQQFPTDIWLPFEPKTDLRVFVVVYLYVFSGVAYAAFSCAAIDPLIAGLAGLAIGQLGVLKDNLQHMNGYTENSKTERKKFIREIIKKSVDQHNAILRLLILGTDDEAQEYDYLGAWGPRFDKLADMYGPGEETEQEEEEE